MAFQPRMLANGRPCCTNESVLCAKCTAHFAGNGARLLRTASQVVEDFERRSVPPPDPYTKGTSRAAEVAEVLHPTTSPGYSPKGTAPDGYLISLGLRELLKDETTSSFEIKMHRDANGTPDGYATALAARSTK